MLIGQARGFRVFSAVDGSLHGDTDLSKIFHFGMI